MVSEEEVTSKLDSSCRKWLRGPHVCPGNAENDRYYRSCVGLSGSWDFSVRGEPHCVESDERPQQVGWGSAFRLSSPIIEESAILIVSMPTTGAPPTACTDAISTRLLGWGIFTLLGYTVLLFSLPNFATSIGLSPSQGSVVGALNSLGQGLGRPIVGLVSDRCGRINTAGTLTFFTAVLCFAVWIPAGGMGVLSFFSVLSGTMSGTYWATVGPVSAEVVGLQMLPSALSITWVSMVAPTTVAEAIALELKKRTGKIYINTQIFTAMMYIAATLCMWLLRGWKIGESEEDAKRAAIFSQQSSVIEKQQETDLSGNETTKEGPQRAIATAAGIRGQRWQPKDLFRRMLLWQRV